MATKNQRVQNLWITDAIRITEPIKTKRNCLKNAQKERVGMIKRTPKTSISQGLWGSYLPLDTKEVLKKLFLANLQPLQKCEGCLIFNNFVKSLDTYRLL